jgi:succinate-semialdehyde dehydrogenase/glutarate-semialdehyde dehydrogenase
MFKSINPFDGKIIEEYTPFSDREISQIITDQHIAFNKWKQLPVENRATAIAHLGQKLKEKEAELARLITLEMGKPITESLSEIRKCAWLCEHYALEGAKQLQDETIQTEAQASYVSFEPKGIIFGIMPWNFPFWQVLRFAIPTLLAGNVVLLKHAPNVCGCALAIEKLMLEAGFSESIFRIVIMEAERSEMIIAHPFVQGVTITGSAKAGASVASLAGKYLKKSVMELGGSDPLIAFADAGLAACCEAATSSRMMNAGQVCIAAKRFIVERPIFDSFVAQQKTALEALKLGDPLSENTQIGPMARPDLVAQIDEQVKKSLKMGAKLITGGEVWKENPAFYLPTLLTEITSEMPVYQEETFGPVAVVIPFDTVDEAIKLANDTAYGLGASIWTKDIDKAKKVASQLEAGSVFINSITKSDPRLPFGGTKKSGYGRELANYGMHEFMNIKTNWIQ